MDRLPEQVVTWHNQHPLAKRISIYDVHTIGVVALPFMRSGPPPRGPVEPVLTDEVSDESLAAWGSEDSTVAANTNAAHLDALADQEDVETPPSAAPGRPGWRERLMGLLGLLGRGGKGKTPDEGWPAFSERFIDGLSARRVARFALEHGYSARPGDESWPHRVIPIDEKKMSGDGVAGGAWPFEIYLVSTAIDAGSSRSRILAGRSAGAALPPMLGKRCLDPKRVGVAALVPLCIVAAAGGLLWHRSAPDGATLEAAAGAASAPPPASSGAASGTVMVATAPASAASEAEPAAASAPMAESHVAEAEVAPAASAAASEPVIDIRPKLVEGGASRPAAPPLMAQVSSAPPPTAAPAPPVPTAAASETPTLPVASVRPDLKQAAQKGTPVVALVAPPTRNKAEAEAMLAKMQELVKPLQPNDSATMQAQLFESPEGWRAAIWPFGSRVEAQIINATLVARGLHTKAVDF
ncbi:hypothetical protein SNE35_00715 [Paucibacter sp. R3-3]|uniref:SPOR domain-containing protein n=1 Tax=Roseateles agri TaxID=3098619 RepID=A0ABU5D9P6_9BURK|nr:hypothetical protein [Paucibacter sp. R3-3]MDY0743001.1 hypothetical protein [Paucibacter sp. R3-3]